MTDRRALSTRVLTAATFLMILFFATAFVALDLAFRRAAESSLEELLQSQVMGLLAAADPADDHMLRLPETLPEARFSRPGSGLYGQVIDDQGETIWTSASALGLRLPTRIPQDTGRIRFDRAGMDDGTELLSAALAIEWEFDDGRTSRFVFAVSSSLRGLHAQVARYRTWLGGGFAALLMILLGIQLVLLRYLMRPLGRAASEVREIQDGRLRKLSDGYPAEIQALSSSINRLIDSERSRTRRYRESLDNLAHSLKTPLAVIRSHLESGPTEPAVLDEQVRRIQDIVDYQLRRAATAGPSLAGERHPVSPAVQQVLDALARAHHDREVIVSTELEAGAEFPGGRDDLLEILGNLLDNAFKFCRSRVAVKIATTGDADRDRGELRIIVGDDGPGLAETERVRLLDRGVRGPVEGAGQGIGLAVVTDIAESLGGSVSLGDSSLGGAEISVRIPLTNPPGKPD
ncbi:MAG: ATP-binding protein [Gammaproteobacteria bacterium]